MKFSGTDGGRDHLALDLHAGVQRAALLVLQLLEQGAWRGRRFFASQALLDVKISQRSETDCKKKSLITFQEIHMYSFYITEVLHVREHLPLSVCLRRSLPILVIKCYEHVWRLGNLICKIDHSSIADGTDIRSTSMITRSWESSPKKVRGLQIIFVLTQSI